MIDITPIVKGIIGLVVAIISAIIIPKIRVWVNNNLTVKQIDIIKIIVQSAVSAAEQIYARSEKAGSSKKKYVMEYAKSKLAEIGLTINDKELEVYLEQAVLELKESQKKLVVARKNMLWNMQNLNLLKLVLL